MTIVPALMALLISTAADAAIIVYDNTTTDTHNHLDYLSGPYDGIGDSVTISGGIPLSDALVQFHNSSGTAGSFDATLTFYNAGAPVGTQIGSPLTLTGNTIAAGSAATLDFSLAGLTLPNNVVFVVSVANVIGASLGLELYDPPAVGSNVSDSAIVLSGGNFSMISTGSGAGNPFFQLSSAVPEPNSWLMAGLGFLALAIGAIKTRSSAL